MTVITLTTDFGIGDHEAGVLKGVIWTIAPRVQIADLSHGITPHDIFEAALLLWRVAPYFPDGTIHLVVVDPGVGTSRRGIAARLGSQYFVGPDNGLLTMVMSRVQKANQEIAIVHLDKPEYWLPEVSRVFHGRDLFAPIAAHLASGVPLSSLGTLIDDPVRIEIPQPLHTPRGWHGQIIHKDHFGNLTTNLTLGHLKSKKEVMLIIKGEQISGLVSTFGERPTGTLVALMDSSGFLAISVVNGNAAQVLNAAIGDGLEVLSVD